jgi:hypothetical protein
MKTLSELNRLAPHKNRRKGWPIKEYSFLAYGEPKNTVEVLWVRNKI